MVLERPLVGIGSCPCASFYPSLSIKSNHCLCSLFTAGTLIGFDASGHIAEETKNASYVAARGILLGAVATAVCGFATTILFLFCTPDLDTLFSLSAPQPFVLIYSMALGRGPSVFMTALAVVGLILVSLPSTCCIRPH